MVQNPILLAETPSQTAGPYVHIGCVPNSAGLEGVWPEDLGARMISGPVTGREITVHGTILDGMQAPLCDAMVEIWQADGQGLYPGHAASADPNFSGWGRCATDGETGAFSFRTVKPGPVALPDGQMQAPHISVWIVARGINLGLHTRIYFADEAEANAADPLLSRIDDRDRVSTLLAAAQADATYRFDIHLQGPDETVFLEI